MLRKITAHLAIIFGGMCFVLFVIDAIKGGAMSFINNDMTKAFIAILSLLAIFNSVISLAGQTNEQRMAARLQQRRSPVPGAPRPAPVQQMERMPVRRTAPAAPRTSAPARPASGRETARAPQRSPYSRTPYQNR